MLYKKHINSNVGGIKMVKKVKKCWIVMFGYALAFTAGLFGHVEQSAEGGFRLTAKSAKASDYMCCPPGSVAYINGSCSTHY